MTWMPAQRGHEHDGCDHASTSVGLNRRRVLQGMGLVGGAALASPLISSQAAYAASGSWDGNVLIVLSLRGGFDGVSAIVPVGDASYAAARPNLAIPAQRTLPTGDRLFGLHPSLASVKPLWDAGAMCAVHAVGTPNTSRSHFYASDDLDRAAPGTSIRTGWLDRALGLVAAGSVFEGVHLGGGNAGILFTGPVSALSSSSLADISLAGADWVGARMTTALKELHQGSTRPGITEAMTMLDALGTVAGVVKTDTKPKNGAVYPTSDEIGSPLADAARLIRANVGLQMLTIDFDNWDFHADFGTRGEGAYADKLKLLADSIAAFATDLGPTLWAKTTIVTVSEFGRRIAENGSGGVDHGFGNAMMLFGGGLKGGGKVLGTWPGLTSNALFDGDLAGTTDYRNVMADILVNRCRITEAKLSTVFPGLTRKTTGAY